MKKDNYFNAIRREIENEIRRQAAEFEKPIPKECEEEIYPEVGRIVEATQNMIDLCAKLLQDSPAVRERNSMKKIQARITDNRTEF